MNKYAMALGSVDLNLFVVFEALYREKSVTRAAALLNLTQPAVSNALGRLRDTFDDRLFVRTPEGMTPTPVAENVAADVRKALGLLQSSIGANAQFDPNISEKIFQIGMNDLANSLLLPRVCSRLMRIAPGISIFTYYTERDHMTDLLKSGSIDLLIDAPLVNAKALSFKRLAAMDHVVAMRTKHPLANTKLSLDAYLSATHLHVTGRRKGRGQVDIALNELGHARDIKTRVSSYLTAGRIVAESDLLWTAPRTIAQSLPLHLAKPPFAIDKLKVNLYWNKNADSDPANVWMRTQLIETSAEILNSLRRSKR